MPHGSYIGSWSIAYVVITGAEAPARVSEVCVGTCASVHVPTKVSAPCSEYAGHGDRAHPLGACLCSNVKRLRIQNYRSSTFLHWPLHNEDAADSCKSKT